MVPNLTLLDGGRGENAGHGARDELSALALAARDGDEVAVTRLWETAQGFLTRIAVALGLPYDDVPDLVQECMWSAHQALESFDPDRGTFEAWTGTILVRLGRNRLRSARRRKRLLDRLRQFLGGRSPERRAGEEQASVEARMTLERLLAVLTDRQRDVVALYEIAELSAHEAARVLGMSEAGVRSIARQAREKLARAARRMDRAERRGS